MLREEIIAIKQRAGQEKRNFVWVFYELKKIGLESYAVDLKKGKTTFKRAAEKDEETFENNFRFGPCDIAAFKRDLKRHQQGETSYSEWLHDSARAGIYRYIVVMDQNLVVYLNEDNSQAYVEAVPANIS